MKNYLKRKLPSNFYQKLRYPLIIKRAIFNHLYDAKSFLKISSLNVTPKNKESYSAIITMEYHKLEKALTLPEPKKIYGITISKSVLEIIKNNSALAAECLEDTATAVKVLEDYQIRISQIQNDVCQNLSAEITKEINDIKNNIPELVIYLNKVRGGAGIKEYDVSDVDQYDFFYKFMLDRKTIRNFSNERIDTSIIEKVISIAKQTPSVCNRQPWKVFYTDDKVKIKKSLSYQNGNNGFGDTATGLFIITSSYKFFPLSGERNQPWIDGGMFSMSLLLALHSCGIAACALNWGNDSFIDKKAKIGIGIPSTDNIIMMVAVGYASESYKVCESHRRETNSFIEFL